MAHVQVAEILLYEVGMQESLCEAGSLTCLDRLELLWSLLGVCKANLTLRLEDDTFIHFVETTTDDGTSALPKLAAFEAFQNGIRERCVEPPLVRGASIVGNYRMLGES